MSTKSIVAVTGALTITLYGLSIAYNDLKTQFSEGAEKLNQELANLEVNVQNNAERQSQFNVLLAQVGKSFKVQERLSCSPYAPYQAECNKMMDAWAEALEPPHDQQKQEQQAPYEERIIVSPVI